MNVYDFDGTIYNGDSTVDFYLYCIKRHPGLLRYLPRQGWAMVRYRLHRLSKTQMKEQFYSFLKGLENADEEVRTFWVLHKKKIAAWYMEKQEKDDVVISASPEFLLKAVCEELGICNLIASRVDSRTGVYEGENCWGAEKVTRFRQKYADAEIDEFYTDSRSDRRMAMLASQAYIKVHGKFIRWHECI